MGKRAVSARGKSLARSIFDDFFARHPGMAPCRRDIAGALRVLLRCFEEDRTLFLCGNGGSHADCLHIGAELVKAFARRRPLPAAHAKALAKDPVGKRLVAELEAGLRALPLGNNGSLSTAILNDKKLPLIHFAQELYVMARRGDVLLALSTSGQARNVLYAMAVARAIGVRTIALTGPRGGAVARGADVAMRLPGARTPEVQESHQACYHMLCLAIEAAFFPEPR